MNALEKIQFMKAFAQVRASQPNDGNRNPVFWLIQNQVDEPCTDDPDEIVLKFSGDNIESAYWMNDDYETLKEDILSDLENNFPSIETLGIETDLEGMKEDINDAKNINDIADAVEKYPGVSDLMWYTAEISSTKKVYKTVYDHVFLTKEAAEKHLEDYSYRYTNPRTYANTCMESPYMETLFEIIDNPFFWSSLELVMKPYIPNTDSKTDKKSDSFQKEVATALMYFTGIFLENADKDDKTISSICDSVKELKITLENFVNKKNN